MTPPMPMRLGPQPREVVDRGDAFSFTWNGQLRFAYRGDTIVSALLAAGERVFSRSFKYHRPRGVLSATYHDPGCLVQVGDEPNVRGAHRRVGVAFDVRAQNVWPSLRWDLRAVNQLLGRFLPPGFYYKTFMAPEALWPAYQRVLRGFAPGGRVARREPAERFAHRFLHPDVVVAGGGPAGMSAAIAAADAGARVLLVEEEPELGGHLRWAGDPTPLRDAIARRPSITVLADAVVTGRWDQNWLGIVERGVPGVFERLTRARAKALVVAGGLIERPYVFAGNDLPGVMLSTAVRRLVNLWAVKPGARAVVLTANAEGDAAIDDLRRAGVEVVAVADARRGEDVVRATGRGAVKAVELADGRTLACDLLVTAVGWTAQTLLLNMAGDRPVYDPRAARFVPGGRLPDDVFVTGGLAGDGTLDELVAHGETVGRAAAVQARGGMPDPVTLLQRDPHPALFQARTHGFVDFSEDVGSKDVVTAAHEGYDGVELVKRYTTATMGPAQGKLETMSTVAVLAGAVGTPIAEIGTTTWRPPYVPVTLGALAGRPHHPVRVSPMQPWHEAQAAIPMVAGQWIRPAHYGDPAGEVRAVREGVGVIDVTPLGKIDLRGADVPKLLNLVYVNKWSQLPVGGVRYGVMCAEDGVVLDDGVTGRLAEERWLMTTTSSGAGTVYEWLEMWLQTAHPDWDVALTPCTAAYASMNVAGPKARALLGRVVEGVDLAFPYMQVREGRVAGVDGCVLWRIGFTGETSWELHVPASYGLHVWETLFAVGRDLGVRPFGVEAQRVLRLEKGHAIVGQDTDGLTIAFAAGFGGLVKLDKDDFAGATELRWQQGRDDYARLVALQPLDPTEVPVEASQIVEGERRIVGRITSSRFSPTLHRAVCLGYVAPHLAFVGTVVQVRLPGGRCIGARVTEHLSHFDPSGERLRG
ncbi:MAG: (2Fe-2S)-binding protein [bacterium]|nr:(2Fe-2S)-binding protein [bacterium]